MYRYLSVLSFLLLSNASFADVIDSSPGGFTSLNSAKVDAAPSQVYSRLVDNVGSWWNSDHTYSGDASNLSIEPRQGGCFCESLPNGGSVRHLEVVYADPGKALRLAGGLGPLQATATTGAMTWQLTAVEDGTEITLTYTVGGYVPEGLDGWAAGVDRVVGEQLERLTRFTETGDPEGATPDQTTNGGSE